jgi:hypothetical protein
MVAATPEELAAIVADFDGIWPTRIGPAPRSLGCRLYEAGPMVWEEFDRPGAARAFHVIRPKAFKVEHWFELEPAEGGTLLRHTLEGHAVGYYEALWSGQIEPFHHRVLEALLDNIQTAVASKGPESAEARP